MSNIAIKRPVTTVMLTLMVIILGVMGLMGMQQELMPDLDLGIAVVITSYDGAGPEEVENLVTVPLRSALSTVSNLQNISTTSSVGMSIIWLEFAGGTDMNHASLNMRENIDMFSPLLPSGVNPMVLQIDPNMMANITLGITGPFDLVSLLAIVEDQIVPRLERLNGVASVDVSGGIAREISVEINPGLLQHYGLTAGMVAGTLMQENVNRPGGMLQQGTGELQVRTVGQFTSVDEIRQLPIMTPGGANIRLTDIAEVIDGFAEQTGYAIINGDQGIVLTISQQSTANIVEVSNLVQAEMARVANEFSDLNFLTIDDPAIFISDTIDNIFGNILSATMLAMLTLLIFLGSLRSPLIIGVSIPVSLITSLAFMFFLDMSLNMITLNAMVISVGMLVDNSIVVLENIARYLDLGYDPKEAAKKGASEVGVSIFASTATTVVIFVPILFTTGFAGEMFGQLGLVIALTLISSLIVALTFVPMAASRFLKPGDFATEESANTSEKKGLLKKFQIGFEKSFNKLGNWYAGVLTGALKRKWLVMLLTFVFFIASAAAIPLMGFEFMASMDSGVILMNIEAPSGALLDEISQLTSQVLDRVEQMPEIENFSATVGDGGGIMAALFGGGASNTANITLQLIEMTARRPVGVLVDEIRQLVVDIPGAEITVWAADMAGGGLGGGNAISVNIHGDYMPTLTAIGDQLVERLAELPQFITVENSASVGNPQARVDINRQQAAFYGLAASQVADVVAMAIGGQTITQYRTGGTEIDVVLRYNTDNLTHLIDLENLMIATLLGVTIPLSEVASIVVEQGASSITTQNNDLVITLTAEFASDIDLGTAQGAMLSVLNTFDFPAGMSFNFGGDIEMMLDSFIQLGIALVLGVLLLYMVMASQFESLAYPFILLFSIPVAWTAGLAGAWVMGDTLNVISFIGLILLSGIVVNNGIVLIDYINIRRDQGENIIDAIVQGSKIRLRPILMTTVTTVAGAIPMILAYGSGAEMQQPLGAIIAFGLAFSTLITLLLIPVLYHGLYNIQQKIFKKSKKIVAEPSIGN